MQKMRKILSKVIFGGGMILIGVIAVPTSILIGCMLGIWKTLGWLIDKLDTQ